MAHRYQSRRIARKLAKKSKRNFLTSIIIIAFLFYATIAWILPFLVNGIGFVKNSLSPVKKNKQVSESSSLAPPILNVPYEATSTAHININGYGSPHSKVAIFVDDDKKDTVEVSDDGTFVASNIALAIGTNNIYGKSIDENNHESLSTKVIRVLYDNEKPKLAITEPEDGKTIQGGEKKIKISGSTEPTVQVFINENQIIVDSQGNFSSIQSLNDGENNFEVKAIDTALNTTQISRKIIYNP